MNDNQRAAYDYIVREAAREADREKRIREIERMPLGGLTLDQFRGARDSLSRAGLIKQVRGRWIPA